MGRRIKKLLGVLVIVMFFCLGVKSDSDAAKMTSSYNLEQAQGKAPMVKAYVNGSKVSDKSVLEGRITGDEFENGIMLRQKQIRKFSSTGEGIHYIILFDNSASVNAAQFQQAKRQLLNLRQSMKEKDLLELYTVGTNDARGEKKRIFASTGKKHLTQDKQRIKKLSRTKKQTVLYRSLTQILDTVDNSKQRTIILLITDGEDDSQGKNNKTYEVNPAVKNAKVPIYGILLKNISKKPNKEKMANTRKNILNERVSRGYYEECSTVKSVGEGFRNIKKILADTYVVSLREENNSNKTTLNASLSLNCNGEEMILKPGAFSYNLIGEKDTIPPVLSGIKKTGSKSIQFRLKDDKSSILCGAEELKNYTVKSEDNKVWKIAKISKKNTADDIYEMIFEEELYSGKYTIECTNITDDSQEKNAITEKVTFSFKGLNAKNEQIKNNLKLYWWIILIVLVLVIGGILVVIVKKKPGKIVEVDAESFNKADSKLIRLTITDRAGTVKDVEWNVEGSIFIGRSDICNIYFDDDRLSKQHFAIEVTKMACYIEDLETTNGTFVNGVKMSGKRMLLDGDVITAGREKFEFHIQDAGGDTQA